jgi:hypothetical protein
MKLSEWTSKQRLEIAYWKTDKRGDPKITTDINEATGASIPDTCLLVDRPTAYRLDDWIVSSCSGGNLFFIPRTKHHHYFLAGSVERGARYEWKDGYSRVTPTGMTYPWLTKREAQRQARSEGAKAIFHHDKESARAALELNEPDGI